MADKSVKRILQKKNCIAMKVTTKVTGYAKEGFLNDCINKEMLETNVAKNILEIHYKLILPMIPRHEFMDFAEIKKVIEDKIKFK
jgi:hypothetical protein